MDRYLKLKRPDMTGLPSTTNSVNPHANSHRIYTSMVPQHNLITREELQELFGETMPLLAVRVLFPERSEPLDATEMRILMQAIKRYYDPPKVKLSDQAIERAQGKYLELARKFNWSESTPSHSCMREIVEAALSAK